MSFRFNAEAFKDNSFNEKIKEKLTKALNSTSSTTSSSTIVQSDGAESLSSQGSKVAAATTTSTPGTLSTSKSDSMMKSKRLDILKSGIIVSKVNFPTMPKLEILDLDISAQPRSLVKGICKISCMDAMLQIQTEIEGNLLLVYSDYSPDFTTPTLICKDSFTIPITMIFSEIQLEAITNIFVKNSGIGISFNDVNLDFKFDCSIKILQSTIEKRLKKSMQSLFKEVLPRVIFNMSQSLFTTENPSKVPEMVNSDDGKSDEYLTASIPKVILEESDLQELSAANMLRLSTLISSRQTLSLHATVLNVPSTIPGCLERQNLHRFNSRIPSLSNYYAAFRDPEDRSTMMKRTTSSLMMYPHSSSRTHNLLPERALEENAYDLQTITNIQTRIFDRSADENVRPRRRKITLRKNKTRSSEERHTEANESATNTSVKPSDFALDSSETAVASPGSNNSTRSHDMMQKQETLGRADCIVPSNAMLPLKLPVKMNPNLSAHPQKALLPLEKNEQLLISRRGSPVKPVQPEETSYFTYRPELPELQRLSSSLYSPITRKGTIFNSNRDLAEPKQLLENKSLSFLGLNNRTTKSSTEDDPPPYQI